LGLDQSMGEVKSSLSACLDAGYALLHIDPTVDRTVPAGNSPDIDLVVARTVELIVHAENERTRLGLPPVAYEVGTEEVHGGLADLSNFDRFLSGLKNGLEGKGLGNVWPCFIVGKVGTDLHTTTFDGETARVLFERVAPYGSLIKGHYSDWVANPTDYPASGMGGANFGPEFTSVELEFLITLCEKETQLLSEDPELDPSNFMETLSRAVVDSGRWKKWLFEKEAGLPFEELSPDRQDWMVKTGARYIWTVPAVLQSRKLLYKNLKSVYPDPNSFVVQGIANSIQRYVDAFNLKGSNRLLGLN
jgi:D-tagatose-1,6-bisphosphate aldolase subunit GatZ/KbaZ